MLESPREIILEVMFLDSMKPDGDKIKLNEDDDDEDDWRKPKKNKKENAISIDSCFKSFS
jgi:hypothetical protein